VLLVGGSQALRDRIARELAAREPPIGANAGAEISAEAGARVVLPELAPGGLRPRVDASLDNLREALAGGPAQVVLLSSTAATGAGPRHTGMVAEDAPLARGGATGVAAAWRELEAGAARAATEAGAALATLRLPSLVAASAPGLFELLGSGRTKPPAGRDPLIQLLAPEDLAEAIAAVLRSRFDGLLHVVPRAPVSLRTALTLAHGANRGAGMERAGPADPETRHLLSYAWTASGARARERLGFTATRSSLEALRFAIGPESAAGPPPASGEDPDPFGLRVELVDRLGRGLFRFLHDRWFRVEVEGLEQLPAAGPVVLVGIHRGFVPLDAMLLLHEIRRHTGRVARFLVHPGLARAPFVSRLIPALGGVPACRPNAERLLEAGDVVGVFPEGVEGAFRPVRGAYRLGRFHREFVDLARRCRAPIVPVVSIGPAEVFPVLAQVRWRWWRRRTDWPCLPISHGMVLPLPLPVKWRTRILAPIDVATEGAGTSAADRALAAAVGERMQEALDDLLSRRRSRLSG